MPIPSIKVVLAALAVAAAVAALHYLTDARLGNGVTVVLGVIITALLVLLVVALIAGMFTRNGDGPTSST